MDEYKQLLVDQLREMQDAERQWVTALPDFARAAKSPKLRQTLEQERERAQQDQGRLGEMFRMLALNADSGAATSSHGMRGLVEAARGCAARAKSWNDGAADTAMVLALQKIKHYEIASYGSARAIAEHIGESEIARLLQEAEQEENDFDARLSEVTPMAA